MNETNDKPRLLPCPFCGSERVELIEAALCPEWAVVCHGCSIGTGHSPSQSVVIDAWNRRAPVSAEGASIQEAIDKILAEASDDMPGTPWRVEQQYVIDLRNWAVTKIAKLQRQLRGNQPLIVTRGDGVPLQDQAAAVEEFKRQALSVPADAAVFREFFDKYALGSKLKPSCFVCGRDDYQELGIEHAELPGIVVCRPCRNAAKSPGGAAATDALDAICKMLGCKTWEYPGQVVRDVRLTVEVLREIRRCGEEGLMIDEALHNRIERLIGPNDGSSSPTRRSE